MQSTDINTTLKDGTRCSLRLCCHSDCGHDRESLKDGIRTAWCQLSPESRYKRFGYAPDQLNDRQLDYLTNLDNLNRLAWCAYVQDDEHVSGIGLARFMRIPGEPGVAEFAVTILDEYQHAGLGSLLLERLIDSARTAGIRTLRGYIRPDNGAMLALAKKYGGVAHMGDEYLLVDINLAPAQEKRLAQTGPTTSQNSDGH